MSLPATKPFELNLLYRDDSMVLVDKPANMLSVPGKGEKGKFCVSNEVQVQFPDAKVVHRLDMATSGVMLFALGKENQVNLNKQFEQRNVEKVYDAVVKGHIAAALGGVNIPLMSDWPNRPKQKVCYREGKQAMTRFRCLSFDNSLSGNKDSSERRSSPITRVELMPVTGRSHQLRMHMLAIGHPIIGDEFYACEEALAMSSRLLLHARELTVTHPATGRRIEITAPTPF